jgi:putative transposase
VARRPTPIVLSCEERSELDRLIRSHSTPQQLAGRARMIVLAADGVGVGETARQLGVWRKGVSFWRCRWLAGGGEGAADRLADAPRSGAPATITPEQICAVVALACERPQENGVPISQWSASDLAREAVCRGIVKSISPRSVGRFLKRIRPQATSRASLAHAQARS